MRAMERTVAVDTPAAGAPVVDGPAVRRPPDGPVTPRRPGLDLRSAVELVGAIVAPTTLLGGLALYFGVVYVHAQAFYFGIDGSTLDLSTQDYVLRSADALFVPLGVLGGSAFVVLRAHAAFRRWASRPDRRPVAVGATWALTGVGRVSFVLGATSVFRPLPFDTPFLFAPVSLGMGTLACAYAGSARGHLRADAAGTAGEPAPGRWTSVTNVLVVGLLLVISLFWAATDYARALGRGRSQVLQANLAMRPGVVVYSGEQLHIEGTGVAGSELLDASAYPFRYEGLRLFLRSGGKLFLLPATWTPAGGRVIVLTDDDRIRVEFTTSVPS